MKDHIDWWRKALIYQVYPMSFKDTSGTGTGDLKGIISGLDYIKSLGADALWLTPVFVSPNADNGYDISDYYNIQPQLGTMEDFERLLEEAHRRDLKIILDQVLNHTSEEHPWFRQARISRENPYYNFYHWWPAEKGIPAVRYSYFDPDGTAWRYNPDTHSYYLHYFARQQPDLNWENPQVRKEIYKILEFWLKKGVDGLRFDSIPLISKDTSFPPVNREEYPDMFAYYAKGPYLHEYLHEMNREVFSKYPDIMTVGEGSEVVGEDIYKFVNPPRRELDMLYGFYPSKIRNKTTADTKDTGLDYSLITLKKAFALWDKAVEKGWPAIYLGNHDQPRMVSRFGNDKAVFLKVSAKMLATFLLTMRGTPYWYAGDELGMSNIKFTKIEQYKDVETILNYERIKKEGGDTEAFLKKQKKISRDNARTPFQWNTERNAGFTTGTPWIKVNPDYTSLNAKTEENDPDSVLNYFKRTLQFRKRHATVYRGDFLLLDTENPFTFTYLRTWKNQRFLVLLNFTPRPAQALPELSEDDLKNFRIALHNYPDRPVTHTGPVFSLLPFEAVVLQLEEHT